VFVGEVEVNGSPFTVRVYDPEKIIVSDIPDGIVGKETHFTVDASSAGVGNLEVAVNDGVCLLLFCCCINVDDLYYESFFFIAYISPLTKSL
jgi:hypothetical protein